MAEHPACSRVEAQPPKAMERKSSTRTVSDAVLYLYFPPAFTKNRFFYVFLENASCLTKQGDNPKQSTDDILAMIDSLQIASP